MTYSMPNAVTWYVLLPANLGKMVAGHVTAHLIGCWHAGEIWGCVTILALSLDGVPLWDQSTLSSPSTVLMDWLGDIP